MRRYYRRTYYRPYTKKTKYSRENKSFSFEVENANVTGNAAIVPATDLEGMRKIKHITISLTSSTDAPFRYAIVYVPQGTTVGTINQGTSALSLYEPNQFVMSCGTIDPDAGPIRIYSPLARNLNSGDAIYLLVRSTTGGTFTINGIVSYAITLN